MKLGPKLFLTILSVWLLFLVSVYLMARFYLLGVAHLDVSIFNYFINSYLIIGILCLLLLQCMLYIFIRKLKKTSPGKSVIAKEHHDITSGYDGLTSLPNYKFFNEIFHRSVNNAIRANKILGLLLIEFDDVHKINESYGKNIGDRVLKELSDRITSTLRAGDVITRVNDQFKILISDIIKARLTGNIAEKILQSCARPISIDNKTIFFTVSIGICIFPYDGDTVKELNNNLNHALQKAKHAGGGIYQYHSDQMNKEIHKYIQFELSLRKAIQNKELVLYYQPQLDLATRTVKSVEALVRWAHPDLGMINPDEFIPLAEETGLISHIGEWAIDEACRVNKLWQMDGYDPVIIAVNFSGKQFHDQDVTYIVAEALKKHNLEAQYLEVEITETTVMEHIESAIVKLNNIHAMGVVISIDDFGMGYTSINYLRQLPINILKIDRAFIKDIPFNQNDMAIVAGIISLGHNLGFEIIAEGVENAQQLQFLAEHHCDIIQGDFYSPPLPENEVVSKFIRSNYVS